MKKNPFKFANRLWTYLRKELPESEMEEVETAIHNSTEIKKLVKELENEDRISNELAVFSAFDAQQALKKVYRNRRKAGRKTYRFLFMKVAAVVLLGLGAGIWWYGDRTSAGKELIVENRAGGYARVLFRTAGGEVYGLDTLSGSVREGHQQVAFENRQGVLEVVDSVAGRTEPEETCGVNTIDVPYGGTYVLKLQDGTRVYLNSGSKLEFPSRFVTAERRVHMSGEAYFEVAANPDRAFIIEVGETEVKVLGTSFNVKAYPEEAEIFTTLVEGKVMFKANNLSEKILSPGEQLCFNRKDRSVSVKTVETGLYTAWKDGLFWFQDLPFEEILKIVGRWYNLQIFYANPEIKSVVFTGKMKMYSRVEDILRKFEKSGGIRCELRGSTLTVYAR